MKSQHLILTFLFLLVLLPFASADKVVTTTTTGGLEINTWEPHTIQQNTDYAFLWDVSQSGMLLKANLTNCTLFFNENGVITKYFTSVGTITSDGNAWYVLAKGGNFSEVGHYNFQIDCYLLSNITISGNALSSLDVTPLGADFDTGKSIAFSILLIALIVLFIFVISKFEESDNYGYVTGLLSLSYFLLTFIVFVLDILARGIFYDAPSLASFTSLTLVIMLIGIFPLIIFLFFYLMSKRMEDSEVKKLTGMGYSDSEARSLKRK